jgi:hypothetical protein
VAAIWTIAPQLCLKRGSEVIELPTNSVATVVDPGLAKSVLRSVVQKKWISRGAVWIEFHQHEDIGDAHLLGTDIDDRPRHRPA